ncbi:MAG: hypothetical protein AB1489_24290 [Acidobacteriota bacterium]
MVINFGNELPINRQEISDSVRGTGKAQTMEAESAPVTPYPFE